MVSVRARGKAKLKFQKRILELDSVLFIQNFNRNLISISGLQLQQYKLDFLSSGSTISRNDIHICVASMEQGLYVLRPETPFALHNALFTVAKPRNHKKQKIVDDNETYLWHLRLGHIGYDRLNRLTKDGALKNVVLGELPVCESCLEGKMTKHYFSAKGQRAKQPLGLVHSDVCGPLNVRARGGYEYFVTFIDDYSRYGHIYLMHKKSETFAKFQEFHALAQNQLGKTLKILRTDRGGEYMDMQFKDHLIELGIESQLTAPSTP